MRTCMIVDVKHENSFRWKWRYVRPDGAVVESERTYALFYECVQAARASGYDLQLKCA